MRAYGNNDGYGDAGYLGSAELRRETGIPGLEAAAFVDTGYVNNKWAHFSEHLSGWGLGLRYQLDGSWYGQVDWVRKIDGRPDSGEPTDHNDRWWFAAYKMF